MIPSKDDEESKDEVIIEKSKSFEFDKTILKFANDSNEKIRILAASCLHELFQVADDNQDISTLKDVFHQLLNDEST